MRTDSDSDHKKAEPPNKKAKCDPGSGPEVTDTGSHSSKKKSKKSSKKTPKSKKTVMLDSDSSESENLCGKLCSQPTKEEIKKHQFLLPRNGRSICWVYTHTGSEKGSCQRVLLPMTSGTFPITFSRSYATTSLA